MSSTEMASFMGFWCAFLTLYINLISIYALPSIQFETTCCHLCDIANNAGILRLCVDAPVCLSRQTFGLNGRIEIRCGLGLLSCSEEFFATCFLFIQSSSLQTVDGEKVGFVFVFVCALFSSDHLYLHLKIEHCSLRAFAATLLSFKNNIPVSLGLLLVVKGSLFTSQT